MSPSHLLLLLLLLLTAAAGDPLSLPTLTSRRSLLSSSNSSSNSTTSAHHGFSHKAKSWVLGFLVGMVAGVVAGAISSVLFRLLLGVVRGRFRDPKGPVIFSPFIKNIEELAFLESSDGIAKCELIGRGGCGEVYRAVLGGDPPRVVAIKRIEKPKATDPTVEISEEESRLLDSKMRQLKSEITTVGHIRHRNLLPLLAHVPRPDCHYLVYEYMKNGSLQDTLNAMANGQGELPWPARFRIARGVAAGLEYLHTQHQPRIIHRDLKPGNVLLDDNLEARIADFGLAKAVPDENTHVTSLGVKGTVGYIAPEYHQSLRYTDKCDVYSFGVILAVLVIGKSPTDCFFQDTEEMTLVKWLRNLVASGDETVLEAGVDRRLLGGGHEKQMVLVLKVACLCTVEDPKTRPSSKDARLMLDQILTAV